MAKLRNKFGVKDFSNMYSNRDWTCGICKNKQNEKDKKIIICKDCLKKVNK
jgi:hypothetical protein